MNSIIQFTAKGLYCPQGDFYIDPWLPVNKAIITHGHSDHARPGSGSYLSHTFTKPIMQARLGENIYETIGWNEPVYINGVKVSLHPAGHIIGSAQVRVEYNNEVWVVSGDYKTENDGISGIFEPVRCNVFVTESTFGLPIYKWQPQEEIYSEIREWIMQNKSEGKASVLLAYSLGKAQRVLDALKPLNETILLHGAVWNMQQALLSTGYEGPCIERITPETPKEKFKNSIIIAPSSADGSSWIRKFEPYALGICSGWMQVRGNMRRSSADAGFVLSDHADWPGLIHAVKATGAEKVYVTHGFQAAFSKYLNEIGIESGEVKTEFGEEQES